jgi:PKD repeat protein
VGKVKPFILTLATLLLATALSGCSSGGQEGTSSSTTTQATTSADGTTTGSDPGSTTTTSSTTTGPSVNTPPVAKLAAANSKGPAPLWVNFTVAATDLDGDNMTYSLNFGDQTPPAAGSLPSPAPIGHNFTKEGNYTVVLTVSDGEASHASNLTITVLSASVPVPPATEYSCSVEVPTTGVVWSGSPVGDLGECTFTETATSVVLVTMAPAAGCRIVFDANPNDTNAGGAASAGDTYPPGGTFGMQCAPPSTGGEGKITLRDA